jgi:uncharacterized SAM-binding protein YcdF (DUF218 family)
MNVPSFFANLILDSLNIFWLLALASIVLFAIKKRRSALYTQLGALAWFFIISVSPLPQLLIYSLENDYPVIDVSRIRSQKPVHIIILGGGHSIAPSLPSTAQLSTSALSRLVEGLRLSHQISSDTLILSGYSSSGRTTHAEMLQQSIETLGVDEKTIMITTPGNTSEEAADYAKRFSHRHTVVLVTSAFHMRRAMLFFNQRAVNAIAAPTDYYIKKDPKRSYWDFRPSHAKIAMMTSALHEYGGIIKFYMFD